jgi:hypothetical protein
MKRFYALLLSLKFASIISAQANFAGLYVRTSDQLDLKVDGTFRLDHSSPCGPGFVVVGPWKMKNDSTVSITFFPDSVKNYGIELSIDTITVIDYKFISEFEISSQTIKDSITITNRKGVSTTYYYYSSSYMRVKSYYPNGKTEWDCDYDWDNRSIPQELTGNCTYYFPTGEISSKGYIKNEWRKGKWKYYDKSGKIIKFELYKNGVVKRTKVYSF